MLEIDIFVGFRFSGRTFECFHGYVRAEEADQLDDLRVKIYQCIERDLFPARAEISPEHGAT